MADSPAHGATTGAAAGAAGGPAGIIIGGALGALGGVFAARASKRFRRRQRGAIQSAREFADATVARITEDPLFQGARDFLSSTFNEAGQSPLAIDFAKSIRAAQSVRGTFAGNIGAAQEAIGTSGFAQRLRTQLLPQAMSFAEAPERLRQSILGFEAPLRVASATGAQLPGLGPQGSLGSQFGQAFTGGISGALGGFQIGSAFDAQRAFSQQLDALRLSKAEREGTGQAAQFAGEGINIESNALQERIRQLSGVA
jgi:hypothetical protein